MCKHSIPTIISNDITDDYTTITSGYEDCKEYWYTNQYMNCGCIYRTERNCDGSMWTAEVLCVDHYTKVYQF